MDKVQRNSAKMIKSMKNTQHGAWKSMGEVPRVLPLKNRHGRGCEVDEKLDFGE